MWRLRSSLSLKASRFNVVASADTRVSSHQCHLLPLASPCHHDRHHGPQTAIHCHRQVPLVIRPPVMGPVPNLSGPLVATSLSRTMAHTVHYPVLSAGQVSLTLGRGTAVDRLLKVLSTARYRAPQATEGKGAEGHQVLQVSVHTVHRLRYGHALTTQPVGRRVCGLMYRF